MNDTVVLKRGTELELDIQSLAYGGMGVAKIDNFVIFVKNAIPGQKVFAYVYKKRKGYAEASVKEVLKESEYAEKVHCNHYYICSKLQSLSYDQQIIEKANQVEDTFRRLGGFLKFSLDNTVIAKQIFNYRNKMEFTFSPHRWVLDSEPEGVDRSFALGLHMTGRYDKILDIHSCHIQPKIGDRILSIARDVCLKNPQLRPYDPKTHIGFLRFLMIRYGFNTPDLMVNIVTSYNDMNKLSPLTDRLLEEVPEITSMVNNVNTRKADVAFGEYETLLYGNPYIHEKLGDLTYEISANSFFQTNTLQGEVLYKEVEKLIDFKGDEIVYDLYCGTGTIGLFLAQNAKEVYGFEVIRSALEDAEKNADFNNIENVQFLKANLDTYFKSGQLPKKIPRPDVVIVDPPRAGMHPDMTQYLPKLKAKKIVYVSCNPTTQARDAKILHDKGYKINKAVMVDMFPHTPHIENIVLFSK
ncbi:MAG: 23S rRNA (uracil(1939)-C(5))-methyltransferase RlmD [Candidatus Marinimicrobia bacterium]|nr:23S rRNA (uracil(1939)-C(5))-methyltransferase RlmD [Candidatus Neomarinimicrobiota bacterium]|tara:strand:- start:402 stop:1808 length:1407 start_codon:yes stop_codon:yes gene_type:complete